MDDHEDYRTAADEGYPSWDRQIAAFWAVVFTIFVLGFGVLWGLDHAWF